MIEEQQEFPCIYCNHPCYFNSDKRWNCESCCASFSAHSPDYSQPPNNIDNIPTDKLYIELTCRIKDQDYSVYLDLPDNETQIWATDHIITLNHISNIHPDNIKSKLLTYLTFL
jgi:hypothetical protein